MPCLLKWAWIFHGTHTIECKNFKKNKRRKMKIASRRNCIVGETVFDKNGEAVQESVSTLRNYLRLFYRGKVYYFSL